MAIVLGSMTSASLMLITMRSRFREITDYCLNITKFVAKLCRNVADNARYLFKAGRFTASGENCHVQN